MAHHDHHAPDLSAGNIGGGKFGALAPRLFLAGWPLFAFGCWMALRGDNIADGARAYLVAMVLALATCLGALFFVIVQHLTRAGWSVAVRRPAEAIAQNLRWIWILFLPIAWMGWTGKLVDLYPWADLGVLRSIAPAEAELVANKAGYLNQKFFFVRSAAYFAVWALLANFFWSSSVRQDRTGSPSISARCRKWSGPAMILFGLSTTFASFDWIMSLSPAWFSTMFGVYFFAACATCGISVITLLTLRLQDQFGRLRGIVSPEHFQDLGKLLFAFGIVFWAYIAFSQFMLIWYGNLPEETAWYLPRQVGGWLWLSWALLLGHFAIPFVFLISRWTKRIRATLTFGCAWMLLFGLIDIYYLVMPHIPHDLGEFATYGEFAAKHAGDAPHLLDPSFLAMTLGVLMLVLGGALRALSGQSLL
ncbi:MAG: hypothetical protein FJY43_11980, partial [Betaproteobacteria bacterium]|nr:hypothetical protein [Betaproteobacteria bacterium]